MARYSKAGKPENNLPESDLPVLNPQQHDFLNLYLFDTKIAGNATACYKKAFPEKDLTQSSLHVAASDLKIKLKPYLELFVQSKVEQTVRTKEYRIAEMEAFADRCEKAGQYGAAFQARQAVGKLEGQYVDLKEDVNKTRDQVSSLKALAETLGNEEALKIADQCGMKDQLLEAITQGNA